MTYVHLRRSAAAAIAACVWALTAGGVGVVWALDLTSDAFSPSGAIPVENTCDGRDVSPALAWKGAPDGAKVFALVADDPDAPAGTWVHWVIYDIPAASKGLRASVPASPTLDDGSRQGINDFRKVGYRGPCPPPGPAHRYYFKLYALDAATGLAPRATKAQLLKAIQGHILEQAELVGKYQRR